MTRTVNVDATYAGMDDDYWYAGASEPVWRGTGLYVPPGEVVTVEVPSAWVGQGLSLRVGAHTDELWGLVDWSRFPELSRVYTIDAATVSVASGFGGPLYLRVPAGTALGEGPLTVSGAVEYARFVTGGDPDAFRAVLANAPLAEFEGRSFVLTVPSGHNHQYGPTNLPGTTECTVNLWSVYASETVVGVDRDDAHPALAPDARRATIDAYVDRGRDFAGEWSVWTCLETYLQLQEAFGWELYTELNATYLAMPEDERPTTDDARVQRWVVESSWAAGNDLTAFYAAWGFPVDDDTRAAVEGLPEWTDHPM